ncbi:hypothetical protein [Roseiconus lacunae]|uniref:Uncharacterized protein n=1 Tax=Roseiconus lacunae TaxID=2605694 RepID=A0ABT7PNG1_9BACT|nr:hypothetical protein [Roseiconus lacunae]MDM4018052.1 hypothetical protein [Roseiconus lacunae]
MNETSTASSLEIGGAQWGASHREIIFAGESRRLIAWAAEMAARVDGIGIHSPAVFIRASFLMIDVRDAAFCRDRAPGRYRQPNGVMI